jgi:hypothetical protein
VGETIAKRPRHRGGRLGLGADDLDERVHGVDHRAETGRESSAAHRNHDALDAGFGFQDLERDGSAAAGLDRGVIEGRYERRMALPREALREGLGGVVAGLGLELDQLGAEAPDPVLLHPGRPSRHDDRRDDSEPSGRPRHALSVVPRRGADDPEPGALAVHRAELQEGAADLERAGLLEVLPFGEEPAASDLHPFERSGGQGFLQGGVKPPRESRDPDSGAGGHGTPDPIAGPRQVVGSGRRRPTGVRFSANSKKLFREKNSYRLRFEVADEVRVDAGGDAGGGS